ncbi:MAG: hypothetical protein AAF217_14465 [Pseudomonadota bacterium]
MKLADLVVLLSVVALSTISVAKDSMAQDTANELSAVTFSSTDTNEDKELSLSELTEMAMNIAISMDSDDDLIINKSEFMEWDFGFHYLAEEKGDGDRYAAVKRVMFAVQDLDSGGSINPRELRINTYWSFLRADLNNDRVLSEAEYLKAWMPILMMKAAPE